MAAYNPNGAEAPGTPGRDEGYLYWLGWLGHVGNSTFSPQDAHGVYRKLYLAFTCDAAGDPGHQPARPPDHRPRPGLRGGSAVRAVRRQS